MNSLQKELSKLINNQMKLDSVYYSLIYIKCIIDNSNYTIQDILQNKELFNNMRNKHKKNFQYLDLLSLISEIDSKEELKRLIYLKVKQDNLLKSYIENKKVLVILSNTTIREALYFNNNVDYLIYKNSEEDTVEEIKDLDELFGVNRNYFYDIKNIDFSIYEKVIIIDYKSINVKASNVGNLIYDIYNTTTYNKEMLVKTHYNSIAKWDRSKLILQWYVKTIVIENSNKRDANSYILYKNNKEKIVNKKISIMMLNDDLLDNPSIIFNIIDKDEEIDNNYIHVEVKDIFKNNMRIGFSMYNNREIKVKTIIDLIDTNTFLIRNINRLNAEINEQLNDLMVK